MIVDAPARERPVKMRFHADRATATGLIPGVAAIIPVLMQQTSPAINSGEIWSSGVKIAEFFIRRERHSQETVIAVGYLMRENVTPSSSGIFGIDNQPPVAPMRMNPTAYATLRTHPGRIAIK